MRKDRRKLTLSLSPDHPIFKYSDGIRSEVARDWLDIGRRLGNLEQLVIPAPQNPNYVWFVHNFEYLKQICNGEWVVIHDQRLFFHGNDYHKLIEEIKKQNIKRPFVTRVISEFWE